MTLADEPELGGPEQAFEDLRAEVAAMRRAVEALPDAWEENRPPDYSPDLGRIAKGLVTVVGQLEAINQHPALGLTPEQHSQAVVRAGSGLMREATQKFDRASLDAERERERLAALIGTIRAKRDQRFWVIAVPALVFVITLFASPIVLSWLPFGLPSQAAAMVMDEDRWNAGQALMRSADSASYDKMAVLYNICGTHTVEFCQKAIAEKAVKSVQN